VRDLSVGDGVPIDLANVLDVPSHPAFPSDGDPLDEAGEVPHCSLPDGLGLSGRSSLSVRRKNATQTADGWPSKVQRRNTVSAATWIARRISRWMREWRNPVISTTLPESVLTRNQAITASQSGNHE
jgi:hypothetical protein